MPTTSRRTFSLVVLGMALTATSVRAAAPAAPPESALRQQPQAAREELGFKAPPALDNVRK